MATVSSMAATDPSPRKEESTGLIVTLVLDEAPDRAHRAAAVEVDPGQTRIEWNQEMLGKLPLKRGGLTPRERRKSGGMPAFALSSVPTGARAQLQFNTWFTGSPYASRWFHAEFAIRDLELPYLSDLRMDGGDASDRHVLARQNSGPIEFPEGSETMEFLDQLERRHHSFHVLGRKGKIALEYTAIRHYHRMDGEVVHLRFYGIVLYLLDPGMFDRFLEYEGHRVTCSIGNLYLYRANDIEDLLPTKVDHEGGHVESSRQRSGQPGSYDSTDALESAMPTMRTYSWKCRPTSAAAFPSVRDGHKPVGPEELFDMRSVATIMGLKMPKVRRSGSHFERAPPVNGIKRYVPDSPDTTSARYRLPYTFHEGTGPLVVRLYNFRTTPPRYVTVEIPWMALDLSNKNKLTVAKSALSKYISVRKDKSQRFNADGEEA